MPWDYTIHDTMTGVLQSRVFPSSNRMPRVLNAGSSGSSVFLPDKDISAAQWQALTTPWARTLVKSRNGVPLFAHLITGRTFDHDKNQLSISHSDFWALLARRTTFGTNGYSGSDPANNFLALVNYKLASMPSWLIWSGTDGPTVNFGLPVFVPEGKITFPLISSLPFSGTDSRTYFDYELHFIEETINEVARAMGGPDVDFVPRFNVAGSLEWVTMSGVLTGGSSDWNMSAPQRGLFNVSHVDDALKQANVIYAVGKGSEADMVVRSALGTPNVPALERVTTYKDIDDPVALQSHANADLALYNRPTTQWSASMLATAGPGIENMPPAHRMTLEFRGHVWEPDGQTVHRLIGITTDETETVQLSFQPTGGA